ncbi:MAG: chemotaxis protein CheW [Planctomycetota bacterium]
MNATIIEEKGSIRTSGADCNDSSLGLDQVSQVVSFRLGDSEYGVNILHVQEIILIDKITRIPHVPNHVRGLINLRGHVIPVIDLRLRLGQASSERTDESRIVVFNTQRRTVGFMVDAVSEVLRVERSQIEPAPNGIQNTSRRFVLGLAKLGSKMLILLDIERMIQSETHGG